MHKLQWNLHWMYRRLNNSVCLYKRNIKLPENRKLYKSKHLSECNKGDFKIMSIYQMDKLITPNKRNNFIDWFKPTLKWA